jgi:N-acetyl-1-D-myo-inositol-2-amino-2-deoxy-alpha-D-glucopyranoside deacetylase
MKIIGVTDHRFLGNYRDSGMMGTEPNNRPDTFWQANLDEAAGKLVEIIREIKPDVLITYDEIGGYGHPDHIKSHQVAMRASELAADKNFGKGDAWDIPKIYWNIMPRSVIEEGMKQLKEKGSNLFGTESIEDLPFVKPDELVTAVIDGSKYVDKKMAALGEHKTQMNLDEPFFTMRDAEGKSVWGFEYYTQVKGEKSKNVNEKGYANDLFA